MMLRRRCALRIFGIPPLTVSLRVGADQQSLGVGIAMFAEALPPSAQRLDGERGGVVVDAHRDPAGVGRDVVGDGLPRSLSGKSWTLTRSGSPAGW